MKRSAITLTTLATILQACGDSGNTVSEAEREERRELTFDISGDYFEDVKTGTPNGLHISNESGFHDISAVFELRRDLTNDERKRLEGAIASSGESRSKDLVGRVEAALAAITLGEEETFGARGGENVVLDGVGDASELVARHTNAAFWESDKGSYTLLVTLYATAYKTGRLDFLTTSHTDEAGKAPNGGKGLVLSLSRQEQDKNGAISTKVIVRDFPLGLSPFQKY